MRERLTSSMKQLTLSYKTRKGGTVSEGSGREWRGVVGSGGEWWGVMGSGGKGSVDGDRR